MKSGAAFKNPADADSSELDELVDDEEEDLDVQIVLENRLEGDGEIDVISEHSEYEPSTVDESMSEEESDEPAGSSSKKHSTGKNSAETNANTDTKSNCCVENNHSDMNEDEEDDDTVRAIIAAIKKPRTVPPEIKLEDFVTNVCFHPDSDIIAVATITGDVCLYKYSNEENILLRTIEVHAKACRDVQFTDDGRDILTCSKDKSIMITDMTTEKLKKFYESAHDDAINKLHIIDEHLFASGDDGGTVKLWDLRTKNEIFALKEVEDYVSQILTNDSKKLLLVTSGDGYLTTLNIGARKLYVQSEPYEEELTCMGVYRGDSKLVVGTSKGRLYSYNWGQFGYHCDMYPGVKTGISEMIPITDRIAVVAGEEGILRACHIAPFRILGIVGQHNMPIESLDISHDGELIASSSHNNDVRFWNIKYFEDFGDIKYNEKHNTFREKRHNLPSSKFSNASDFFADLSKNNGDVNE